MGGGEGQGRCERRSEVFVKIQKEIFFWGGSRVKGGGSGPGDWVGGQDICEQRSEVFCENSKRNIF